VDGVKVTGNASCGELSGVGPSAGASVNYTLFGGLMVDAKVAATAGFGTVLTMAVLDANFILTTPGPVRPGRARIQLSQDSGGGGGALQMMSTSIGPYGFSCNGLEESCTNFKTVPFTLGEPFDVVFHQFATAQNSPIAMAGSGAASEQFLNFGLSEVSGTFVPIQLAPEPRTGWQLVAGLTCALLLARATRGRAVP
jgi:hypothetical protein